MTNMSYMLSTALVMLLWITNLSVSYDITCTGYTVLLSNTISKQNVWLLVRIQSHLFLFQHSHSNKLPCESNHGSKFLHFDNSEGLGEQISWVFFSWYVIRFNNLIFILFTNVVVMYIYMLCLSFHCWIYC